MSRTHRASMGSNDKEMRRLLKAIENAGGRYERTGRCHFKVFGPSGIAIIANRLDGSPRARGNTYTILRRHAGLDIS